MIRVESATRRYGSLTAVDDVSFNVEKGEIVGFLGPNGAGKSTMLKMLSTFIAPSAGRIEIGGLDVVRHSLAVRKMVGYLPGDTPLYQQMRVGEFLRFVGRARGLESDALKIRFDKTVQACGLDVVLSQRVNQCSTGFRQRIGLATALIHDPPVLLLDEPTHGFDPLQVLAFRQMLLELKPNRAILFSTHIVADAEAISDRVIVIHEGRLLAAGTIRDLGLQAGVPEEPLERIFANLVERNMEQKGDV